MSGLGEDKIAKPLVLNSHFVTPVPRKRNDRTRCTNRIAASYGEHDWKRSVLRRPLLQTARIGQPAGLQGRSMIESIAAIIRLVRLAQRLLVSESCVGLSASSRASERRVGIPA